MDAAEARRLNLQALAKKHGSYEALGKAVDSPPTHLRNIANRVRNMGARLARKIEGKLELAPGWMDTRHHHAAQQEIEGELLLRDFEILPPALQEHVAKLARELRELVEGLPNEIRSVISAPPQDPARYAEWESNIRALTASEGR